MANTSLRPGAEVETEAASLDAKSFKGTLLRGRDAAKGTFKVMKERARERREAGSSLLKGQGAVWFMGVFQ